MSVGRNPVWARDELILALDLYFQHRPRLPTSEHHPDIVALSQLLNRLPIFAENERRDGFRNPSGVYMKLANFQYIDPDVPGGLDAFGRRDAEIWAEFAYEPTRLHQTAAAIRANASSAEASVPLIEEIELEEASEGKILLRVHLARERNQAIVRRRKEKALAETGRLECEVCGFDFEHMYSELGRGFIECHHTVPLAALTHERRTALSELALVCSNCHRMIHRSKPMKTTGELRALLLGSMAS